MAPEWSALLNGTFLMRGTAILLTLLYPLNIYIYTLYFTYIPFSIQLELLALHKSPGLF